MIFTETGINLLHAFNNPKIRTIIMPGGTSSGKTYSILELIAMQSLKANDYNLWSICSESLPHLKKGAIRDFKNIARDDKLWNDRNWNATDRIYKLGKNEIEFFSAGNGDTLRGSRRSYLFLNEANNLSYEAYKQLMIRTKKKVILDYNPSHDTYIDEYLLTNLTDSTPHYDIYNDRIAYFVSTYKDNHTLEAEIIKEIEAMKDIDPEWFKVYGLGQKGSLKSAIYQNWKQCDNYPKGGKFECLFLDFGFTNDPTAIGKACVVDGQIFTKELLYRDHMDNYDISEWLKSNNLDKMEIICDCSEPKSVSELNRLGIRRAYGVKPELKKINPGIDLLQQYVINVTKDSLNAIKELRFYKWKEDKYTGKYINVAIDRWNHFLDGFRYWAMTKLTRRRSSTIITPLSKENARDIYK